MPYTPQLNDAACTTLRRLAWAVGKPMTKTMQEVFQLLALFIDSSGVCSQCKDQSKCKTCFIDQQIKDQYKNELFKALIDSKIIRKEFFLAKFESSVNQDNNTGQLEKDNTQNEIQNNKIKTGSRMKNSRNKTLKVAERPGRTQKNSYHRPWLNNLIIR